MKDIRPLYESFGADEYYRQFGQEYQNPHEPEVGRLLQRNAVRWDRSGSVLDFSAGGGEATLALRAAGMERLSGCDPYTYALYEHRTGLPCERHSFMDVIKGADVGRHALVVCSFALHLCPEKDLFPLVWALLQAAPRLVVITPHKRPELERLPGIELLWEDFELTVRGKKVRLREYGML